MGGGSRRWIRLLAAAAAVALIGCSGGAASVPAFSQPAAIGPAASPSVAPAAPAAAAVLETAAVEDVVFASAGIVPEGRLDVIHPTSPGPWPVVVMFHGGFGGKASVATFASMVAKLGFVVFDPNWGQAGGTDYEQLTPHEQAGVDMAHAACAVSFATEQAVAYGGDPDRVILFGYSAGATPAAIVAFARTTPRAGCLATGPVDPDVLITLEGDWLLAGLPVFDDKVRADPLFFEALTPWAHVADRPDLAVIVLVTAGGGEGGPAADALGPDGWLARRDPDGRFRAALESFGAFDDGVLDVVDLQRLWADHLRQTGNLTAYQTLEESNHDMIGGKGRATFLDAFVKAAKLTAGG